MPGYVTKAVAVGLGSVLAIAAAGSIAYYATRISNVPPKAPDYRDDKAWLCRPGRKDACSTPTTATIFESANRKRVETYLPDPDAPIDCFYLYPTVSRVRAAYSPIDAGDAETAVARAQLARFTSVCRPFAPLYRQVTVAGLPDLFRGWGRVTLKVPYEDVLAAWKSYLEKDNAGRGVVLIGHSQGARLLARLMAQEIDGKPIAGKLVSAIIPGTEVDVPIKRAVGGSFQHIPLCSRSGQTGCVIAYSSYPADQPLPLNARFGESKVAGMRNACVDPSELAGTKGLGADLPLSADMKKKLGTDYAALPGLFSARCRFDAPFSILAVSVSPEDRTGEDTRVMLNRMVQYNPQYGLHALDINLALGSLVEVVRKETASYLHP